MSSLERYDTSQYMHAIQYIEAMCRAAFDETGSHGWEHVERVRALCKRIGEREGANLLVLDLAAIFHDAIRLSGDHAHQSADFARSVISTMGFSEEICSAVHEVITNHSYSGGGTPKSLEARILSDADKIDAMGAIGIYRTIQFNAERGLPLPRILGHIKGKLLKLPNLLYTNTGKEMAKKRISIMENYLRCLEEELLEISISK